VALSFLTGDGDLDAFVANDNQANRVWLNDGTGSFSDSGQSLGSSHSYGMALSFLTGDGDLDAFVANKNQGNRVWLNDGTGPFTGSGQNLGSSNSYGVALADLEGDGDLDAFVANGYGQSNRVWLNDGTGHFSGSGQNLGSSFSFDVALSFLTGDGDLDAFVANDNGQANRVWLNDGTGSFTDSGQSLGSSSSVDMALSFLTGDGDLDAFVANYSNQANRVWLNDGTGHFTDSGQNLGSSYSHGMALADLTGDGDLDAFVANNSGQANKVWLNQNPPTPTLSDVRITNLRDVLFTVSWLTNLPTTGEVHYGSDPNNLNMTAYDTRGMNTVAETHYVSVENLLPETTTYFEVVSDGIVSDGSPYQITTGSTIGVPGSDSIFGQVLGAEAALLAEGSTLAAGTIVYITLEDGNDAGSSGLAAPLSALVDQEGYWFANLASTRFTDLTSYFTYSASGDQLQLEAYGSANGTKCQKVDTGNDSPAPTLLLDDVRCVVESTLYLEQGWNKVAWPLEPINATNAEMACEQISAQGGSIAEIDQWQGGDWSGHICGYPFNNFTLDLARGYFIKANHASDWTISGTLGSYAVSLTLQAGWNSLSLPHTEGYTAESLCDEIISQGVSALEIDRWHTGGWAGHICGLSFNDFALERGQGYFVKASSAGTVIPPAPALTPPAPLSLGEKGEALPRLEEKGEKPSQQGRLWLFAICASLTCATRLSLFLGQRMTRRLVTFFMTAPPQSPPILGGKKEWLTICVGRRPIALLTSWYWTI
jgi:hypothetical protein